MKETFRSFIAFDFDEEYKNKLLQIQSNYKKLINDRYRISYTKHNQFHITTLFLGDITYSRVKRIIEIFPQNTENINFNLQFKNIDYFPSKKNPSVAVLKSESNETLNKFVKDMDNKLNNIGFKRDKKWIPHITIGRIREKMLSVDLEIEPFIIPLKTLNIYKSTLTPQGSIYEKIFSLNL